MSELNKVFPPGFGGDAIPSIQQFVGLFNAGLARVFRNPDEAYITDRIAAESMLHDLAVVEPLNSRMLATALLPYHVEPEDHTDPVQQHVAKRITQVIEDIPEFRKYLLALLWGLWYGSAGVQNVYYYDFSKGGRLLKVKRWSPVHGDSIRWRWDEPGKVGIMVTPQPLGEGTQQISWVSTDTGPCHFLDDSDREQFVIHRHLLTGGTYYEPQKAGLAAGVGIRNYVWWYHRQKIELQAMLAEYLERWGAGFTYVKYPMGNEKFQTEAESLAQSIDFSQVATWPILPSGEDTGGIERIQPESTGIQNFLSILDGYYNKYIRRFITGVDLAADGDVTIIGQDDSHENSFARIVRLDALNLADTLTDQLVAVIQKWSFPDTVGKFRCRFVLNVNQPSPGEFMQAVKLFYDMGGEIDEDQVRNELRLSKPKPGASTLKQKEQPAAVNPFSGEDPNAKQQLPQPGRSDGEWQDEQGPKGGNRQRNSATGKVRYRKKAGAGGPGKDSFRQGV